jgi:hypothetical protein
MVIKMNTRVKMGIFICLLTFIIACGAIFMLNRNIPPDYADMAHQIRTDVAAKLTKRYNMRVIGVTGGMADCVNVIGLSFQIRGPLSKEKLREILVDCVEEFLTPINESEKIRPFLKNYPFTEKEIIIKIFIVDETGIRVYDPDIAVATAINGKVRYDTEDINDEFGYKQQIREDYQIALEIVRGSKSN